VKKNKQDSDIFITNYSLNKNLEVDKVKTTDVNILLNRVRQNKKKEIKKNFFLTSLIFLILLLVSFVTFK
tara:strand:- start:892 stop:1101 length:210 start_codon:yes stop_codon:yes gene_type:complete